MHPERLERGKPSEDVQRYICTDAVTTVECDNREKKNNKNKKNIWRPAAAGGNPTAQQPVVQYWVGE